MPTMLAVAECNVISARPKLGMRRRNTGVLVPATFIKDLIQRLGCVKLDGEFGDECTIYQ